MTPVILVPGLFGCHLRERRSRRPIWGTLGALYVGPPLHTAEEAEVGGLFESVAILPPILSYPVYRPLHRALMDQFGHRSRDLILTFAYDWRRRIPEAAQDLARFIINASDRFCGPVDLLTYSSGGLALRAAFAAAGGQGLGERVRRAVLVAPPLEGSFDTIVCLHQGFRMAPLGRRLMPAENLATPAALDLLPAPGHPLLIDGEGRDVDFNVYSAQAWQEVRFSVFAGGAADQAADLARRLGAARAFRERLAAATEAPSDVRIIAARNLPTRRRAIRTPGGAVLPSVRQGAPAVGPGDGKLPVEGLGSWPESGRRAVRWVEARTHRSMLWGPAVLRAVREALSG